MRNFNRNITARFTLRCLTTQKSFKSSAIKVEHLKHGTPAQSTNSVNFNFPETQRACILLQKCFHRLIFDLCAFLKYSSLIVSSQHIFLSGLDLSQDAFDTGLKNAGERVRIASQFNLRQIKGISKRLDEAWRKRLAANLREEMDGLTDFIVESSQNRIRD